MYHSKFINMKKAIFLFVLLVSFHFSGIAQSEKYMKAMEDKVSQVEQARTVEKWQELANAFERIGEAEKEQWLPFYYAALSRVMMGNMMASGQQGGFADKTDPEADKAEQLLAKASALTKENSEIWCIKKMIATLRMMADPMTRFQKYGMEASEALQKARQLDQQNPRTYLLEGQDKFYTPEQFGGSKTEAKSLFEESIKKQEIFKPLSSIHPSWGMGQAKYFYSLCN
jgi:uncharacterized protein YpiB (UPF0302 family)